MAEFIVTLEIGHGDEYDIAVRVKAADPVDAENKGGEWADAQGMNCTGTWSSSQASEGSHSALPLIE